MGYTPVERHTMIGKILKIIGITLLAIIIVDNVKFLAHFES